jgi:hypothetical protein
MYKKLMLAAFPLLFFGVPAAVQAKVWVLIENECKSNNITGAFDPGAITARKLSIPGEVHFCLRYEDRKDRRCEVSYQYLLERDRETVIKFDAKLDPDWSFDDAYPTDTDWAAIFQIHEKPDKGERWRCPVAALEVVAHQVRMFNRWDNNRISDTENGTCAGASKTIQSRTVVRGEAMDAGKWHHFEIHYRPSLDESGFLIVKMDDRDIGEAHGPTSYNDESQPYIKFGIYKPTAWREHGAACLTYRNISVSFVDQPEKSR